MMGQYGVPDVMPSCDATAEKERKGYAFQRQFDEKSSIIRGCPGCNSSIPDEGLLSRW